MFRLVILFFIVFFIGCGEVSLFDMDGLVYQDLDMFDCFVIESVNWKVWINVMFGLDGLSFYIIGDVILLIFGYIVQWIVGFIDRVLLFG